MGHPGFGVQGGGQGPHARGADLGQVQLPGGVAAGGLGVGDGHFDALGAQVLVAGGVDQRGPAGDEPGEPGLGDLRGGGDGEGLHGG